jgi:hypothetical protein
MNNLGKRFVFIIDASGSAAFVWLALSTVSSSHPTQTGSEWNCRCRFVACVPANHFIASHGYARLLAYPIRNRQPSLTV